MRKAGGLFRSSCHGPQSRSMWNGFGTRRRGRERISRRNSSTRRAIKELRLSAPFRLVPWQRARDPRQPARDLVLNARRTSTSNAWRSRAGRRTRWKTRGGTTSTTMLVIERARKRRAFVRARAHTEKRRTTPRRVVAPASRARASFLLTFFLARKLRLALECSAAMMTMTTTTTTAAAAAMR